MARAPREGEVAPSFGKRGQRIVNVDMEDEEIDRCSFCLLVLLLTYFSKRCVSCGIIYPFVPF